MNKKAGLAHLWSLFTRSRFWHKDRVSFQPTASDLRNIYHLLLGREPDAAGFRYWMDRLGTMSLDDLVSEFLNSAEFRQRQFSRLGKAMDFPKPPQSAPCISPLVSQVATQAQIDTTIYWRWCDEIGEMPHYHRKQWEYVFLLQALEEAGMLREGSRGLGFGVGREPIPSVLAKYGCELLVTDLEATVAVNQGWRSTAEHSKSVDELHRADLCEIDVFRRRVQFRTQDMNAISDDLKNAQYDFVWSLCALEHLGSLENGLKFIKESLACIKPGGVAVHTTEYNLSSDRDTVASGKTVLYRRFDIESLAAELRQQGYGITLNFHPGDGPLDRYYDVPPYKSNVHLKFQLDQYIATSIGLIIRQLDIPKGE